MHSAEQLSPCDCAVIGFTVGFLVTAALVAVLLVTFVGIVALA
jgi:hypothetical protein